MRDVPSYLRLNLAPQIEPMVLMGAKFHKVPSIKPGQIAELKDTYSTPEIFAKFVALLTADVGRLLPELKQSVRDQEMFRIHFYLKRLKSTIANAGALRARDMIEAIEYEIRGREIHWPTVRALVSVLDPECHTMCEEVKRRGAG